MKGLFQCPPWATPWGLLANTKTPCKGKSFKYEKLLPLQGVFVYYVFTQGDALG